MRIAAILRNAPDPQEDLPLGDDGLVWDEVAYALDLFDDYALEEAVLIKERTGAELIAVGLARDGARLLQTAIARGADRAVRVQAKVGDEVSSRSLAPVLAQAVRELGADLVVTGVQAPGDLTGALAPYLAAALGWPQVNGVTEIEAQGDRARVRNDLGAGRTATLSVGLPAVLGVQASRRPPGYVSGTKLRKAIEVNAVTTLNVDVAPGLDPVRAAAWTRPARERAVVPLGDDPEIAAERIAGLVASLAGERRLDA